MLPDQMQMRSDEVENLLVPSKYPIENIQHVLAVVHQASGRSAEAIPIWEKLQEKYGDDPNNRSVMTYENNLGVWYMDLGQFDKAIPILKHTLASYVKQLTADHPLTLNCLHNLGTAYGMAGTSCTPPRDHNIHLPSPLRCVQ